MYMNCFCIRIAKELSKSEPGSSRNPNDQDYKRNSTANTLHILPQHWERFRWRICFFAVSSPTFGTVMVFVSLLDFFCTLAGSLRNHPRFHPQSYICEKHQRAYGPCMLDALGTDYLGLAELFPLETRHPEEQNRSAYHQH